MAENNAHPVSRRALLAAGIATVGGALVKPLPVLAATMPEFAFTIISDTHLGLGDQPRGAELLTKVAAETAAAPGDFILHLGDIVDGGREAQYPAYLDIRKNFTAPVVEIPGNHDPLPLFEKHVRRAVDVAFTHKGVRVVMFNNARYKSHNGYITPAQLDWFAAECQLAARNDLFVLICTHVPVHTNAAPDREWYVKPENGQTVFYQLLDQHRDRVLAVLHGHMHCGLRGWEDRAPVHEIACPSVNYNKDLQLTQGGAPGYNLPDFRAGYVRAAFTGGNLVLTYKPVGAAVKAEKTCALARA